MTLVLRYMRLDDIDTVVTIDREAFETAWSARSYAYEVSESTYSHMLVLEKNHVPAQASKGWRRFFSGLSADSLPRHEIIGYGGLWLISDEAHISTIATHHTWRGQGYGELLLVAMIRRALTLNAAYVVLEVRVSNTRAQNLYHKYEFQIVDIKKGYYRDNGEDAYDMRLDLCDKGILERFKERLAAIQVRHPVVDEYSNLKRPER